MKKSTKIIALVLVAVMCVAVLASCGAPASDPDKALASLKDEGFAAAKDTLIIPAALRLLGVKEIDTVISGTKAGEDTFDTITVIYFTSASAAGDAMETVEKYANDNKSKDAKDSDWVFEKSGKMIYFGTKGGVKAAG